MNDFITGPCPVLIERALELSALSDLAAAVARGGARLLLVTGESGAGKSRLIEEFLVTLPEGWATLSAEAHPTDRSAGGPFEPLVGDVPPGGEPARSLGRALAQAVTEQVTRPVAFLVEDLHWLDPVGIGALPHALTALSAEPVLVLATYRLGSHTPASPHARAVGQLLRHRAAHELRLSLLSEHGVAEMAEAIREAPQDPAFLSALWRRTAGNPFFVEEMLRSAGGDLPWTLTEAVLARVADLPAEATRLLSLLSIGGAPLPSTLLHDLLQDAAAAEQMLLDRALATREEGDVRLRHALVGEAVAERLGITEKKALHASLASALEKRPESAAEDIADHWSEAGDVERAAPWAAVAAERVGSRRAYRTAVRLYRLAAHRPPPDPAERGALFERAAAAAAMAGETETALGWSAEADAAYRAAGEAWRATSMWLNPALRYLPKPAVPDEELPEGSAQRLLGEAHAAVAQGDIDGALDLTRQALSAATRAGDLDTRSEAAMGLLFGGDAEAAEAALEDVRLHAELAGDRIGASRALGNLSRAARARGDVERATTLYRDALAQAKREHESMYWCQVQAGLAFTLALRGDLAESLALSEELLSLDNQLASAFAQAPIALCELERGNTGEARKRIDRIMAVRSLGNVFLTLPVLWLRARIDLESGDPRSALSHLEEARAIGQFLLEETRPDRLALEVAAAHAVGDGARLERAAAELEELALFAAGPGVTAAAEFAAAVRALHENRLEEARARFESAARTWETTPRLTLAADAWCAAATVALAGEAPPAAESSIARAAAVVERLDLAPLRARLAELRKQLEHSRHAVPTELAGLTGRELQIVALVGAGHTNREIAERLYISERTARNHLSAIFNKLGVSRRAELAALAARAGLERGK